MKITVEIDTGLALKQEAIDLVLEILYGGVDMLNESSNVKEGIMFRILEEGED